jgi:Holliday junction resolvase RusA-like endonuclease
MIESRQELYFSAFGNPKPQGSKRYVGNGRFVEASDVKPWRKAIAEAVFRTWTATGDERPFTEPVVVYATFFMPRPKSVKRWVPTVPPDLDKLCRALGDGLSVDSQAIVDDSLIIKWVATKIYADAREAGVRVAIKLATEQNIAEAELALDSLGFDVCEYCGK